MSFIFRSLFSSFRELNNEKIELLEWQTKGNKKYFRKSAAMRSVQQTFSEIDFYHVYRRVHLLKIIY